MLSQTAYGAPLAQKVHENLAGSMTKGHRVRIQADVQFGLDILLIKE
jgi:hypothetical protein